MITAQELSSTSLLTDPQAEHLISLVSDLNASGFVLVSELMLNFAATLSNAGIHYPEIAYILHGAVSAAEDYYTDRGLF